MHTSLVRFSHASLYAYGSCDYTPRPIESFFPLIVKLGSVTTVVNAGFGYQRTGFSVYTSLAWTLV